MTGPLQTIYHGYTRMITSPFATTRSCLQSGGREHWRSRRRHCRVLEFCVIYIHIIVVVVGICFPYGLYPPSNFFLSFFIRPSIATDSYKHSTTSVRPMLRTTLEIPFVPEPIAKDIFVRISGQAETRVVDFVDRQQLSRRISNNTEQWRNESKMI